MTARLHEDHERARLLAEGLRKIEGITIPYMPETNILIFEVDSGWRGSGPQEDDDCAVDFVRCLKRQGILALALDRKKVRMVTHYDLPDDVVERTINAVLRTKEKNGFL